MSGKELSRDELDQLAALAAMPDEQIHIADIPEASAENWRLARRASRRVPQQPLTVTVDPDLAAWFQERADEGRSEAEINRVLRRYVETGGKLPA